MPFLRNEFSKTFWGPFYDDLLYKDDSYLRFHVGDILRLVLCKMSSRKLQKLNGTPEFHPTPWGLNLELGMGLVSEIENLLNFSNGHFYYNPCY